MAESTPQDGVPRSRPENVPDLGKDKRQRRAPKLRRPNDRQTSADYDTPNRRPSQKAHNNRNRNNLASQIRSLEKILKHPGSRMTANVRQEKGRELAALVLERERKIAKKKAVKNLGKYHMVRFVERQKCERILKGLRKQLEQNQESRRLAKKRAQAKARARAKTDIEDSDTDMDVDGGAALPDSKEMDLEAKIEQAEIDLNYTIYAPLGEKYISLFPPTGKEKLSGMSHLSKSFLEPKEEAEVRRLHDGNVVRNATGDKPPVWFQVQKCMQKGTLKQLRDGHLTAGTITLPQVESKNPTKQGIKFTPDWLGDGDAIAAEEVDSDEDDQKIDGGFFEEL
jgi:hypothetical protein